MAQSGISTPRLQRFELKNVELKNMNLKTMNIHCEEHCGAQNAGMKVKNTVVLHTWRRRCNRAWPVAAAATRMQKQHTRVRGDLRKRRSAADTPDLLPVIATVKHMVNSNPPPLHRPVLSPTGGPCRCEQM
jgi:hypothetical protein